MGKLAESPKYSVPALEKSIAIMDYLALAGNGVSFTDLSKELGLPKTSVYTILNTLESYGFIRKSPGGSYHLGLKLYSLGMSAIRGIDTATTIVPYMEQLRDETNFTVHLGAYDKGEFVCLEKIEGPGMVRFQSYRGERKKMNTSAVGKAIAAYLPEQELQLVISKGLISRTPNSIATENAFREHLHHVRECGYAIDDEEGEMGVRCIGVPVFMSDGIVYGGISLTTLKGNLPVQSLPQYGNMLIEAGREISSRLGYKGPYPVGGIGE
ncbi:IclR family transcriptional regulator [Paenibacillus mesophilus]|uniref:IclR family transcriptional regulator n=1 Tax=Paenibacillus mesophilus TaxID=2582849 RepID=UPI00110F3D5C|nr:IclR family transcriptional regulator [Paenibacillus mesophilus]TMV49073.1 IclR family transcriptional regulator [Paenibacillus mesophilus]